MKRTFLSFLLLICMLFPYVLALSACDMTGGGSSDGNQVAGKLTEEQWMEAITPTAFTASSEANMGVDHVKIEANGTLFSKRLETANEYSDTRKTYIRGGDNTYRLMVAGDKTQYKWQAEALTGEEYQNRYTADVAPWVQLLTYFENNFSKFTFVSNDFEGWYELTVAGSEIEAEVAAIKQLMGVSGVETTKISAQMFRDGMSINFENDTNPYVINVYFGAPLFDCLYSFSSLTSYTITASDPTAADYCVTKVTPEGFIQYYPNAADGIGSAAVCGQLIAEGTYAGEYYVYVREGASWVKLSTPQFADYYKEYTFDTYVSPYLADYTRHFNPSRIDLYEVTSSSLKFKESYTFECRRWTHTYKDLTLTLNENFEVSQITLQASTHDSATNTDTAFIPVTVTVGNATITFPEG